MSFRSAVVRGLVFTGIGVAATRLAAGFGQALNGVPEAMGESRRRIRREVRQSAHYNGQRFVNSHPVTSMAPGSAIDLLKAVVAKKGSGKPPGTIPLWPGPVESDPAELAVTWYGHASVLIEIDGYRILADPVWAERVSPSARFGPKRLHPVPIALSDIPEVDLVIISHDHYDHLDLPTIKFIAANHVAPFLVPQGVGAHLRRWGIAPSRIVELDWNQQHRIGDVPNQLTVTCTEAQHFSGRGLTRDGTLWSSWVLATDRHRVFFGGDTGYTAAFSEIGRELGPFDLSLIPIGAYGDQWQAIHLNPEEAVATHRDLMGGLLIPIHWATFDLAFHTWVEPIQRLLTAAAVDGINVAVPMPGQRVIANREWPTEPWWEITPR